MIVITKINDTDEPENIAMFPPYFEQIILYSVTQGDWENLDCLVLDLNEIAPFLRQSCIAATDAVSFIKWKLHCQR